MLDRISATTPKPSRKSVAERQPHRRNAEDPEDPRLECPLGRLYVRKFITEDEYNAGCRWRRIYWQWLVSIGAPNPFPSAIDYSDESLEYIPVRHPNGDVQGPAEIIYIQRPLSSDEIDDEVAAAIAKAFKTGERILKACGVRVFHAVNAIAVYEEPEELGDFEFTAMAAKKGLAALAEVF